MKSVNYLNYFFKGSALLVVLVLQVGGTASPLGIIGWLAVAALWVYREKYNNHALLMVPEYATILALSTISPQFLLLIAVPAFDLAARGWWWAGMLLAPAATYFISDSWLAAFGLLVAMSVFSGHLRHMLQQKEASFLETYDQERSMRYSLEETKNRLLTAARDAAYTAEIRERNRIARDIHDHVGHKLAGILLQLQVIRKLATKDPAEADKLVEQSITELSGALELLRDTVHNLKPRQQPGLETIRQIIESFRFCPVKFQSSGDFDSLSALHSDITATIIKEALTNAAGHSQATEMEISLEIRDPLVRLFIKDNGRGSGKFREGLGLKGMRERVRSVGGSISFSGDDGFTIVCILPRNEIAGGVLGESADSR